MSYHYYRQNIITDLPKLLADYNKNRQWRQVKNRDKIVLVPHSWSNGPIVYLEPVGKFTEKGRFVCEVERPVKLMVFNQHILTIDPVRQCAWFTNARLWPCVLWRISQWLPAQIRYEKYNRHTPGQIVVHGGNVTLMVQSGLCIFANGCLDRNTSVPPVTVQPTPKWTPYIRRTLKTLRKLVEPYEPWRELADDKHHTFGWQAMRSRREDKPEYRRVEEVLQWIKKGDSYDNCFEAYADFISLGGWWGSSEKYKRAERQFKRALLARMCSKPVV